MMLEHLGEHEIAQRVERAVDRVLEEGPRTPDLGGNATTLQFAEAVARAL
jgi:homoisocitrate dehydrogenase